MHVFVASLLASGGRSRDGQCTEVPPGQSDLLRIPPIRAESMLISSSFCHLQTLHRRFVLARREAKKL